MIFALITMFLEVMGTGLSSPILPKLIANLVGDVSTASYYFGAIATTYALMLFVFSPIQGVLSDWWGRKPVLLLSLLGTGLCYLTLIFAPTVGWIFAAQLVNGLTGASVAVIAAYIADISSPQERAKNFGLMGATIGIGWVFSPAIGGLLGVWGLRFPFVVAAVVTFMNLLYGLLVMPESHAQENRHPFTWARANPLGSLSLLKKNKLILSLAGIVFCSDLGMQYFLGTWVLFTTYMFHWTTFETGLSLAELGLLTALIQGKLIRTLINRVGEKRTILIALSSSLLGFLLFAYIKTGWMMYLIIFFNSFYFAIKPICQGLISNQVNSQEQGAIQGALVSQMALVLIVSPLIATNLFGYFTGKTAPFQLPEVAFFSGAFMFALALWLAIKTFIQQPLEPISERL
jgi:MFS transporter, DHA1 family, tetracycline resistance protein